VRKLAARNVALLHYPVNLSADPTSALAADLTGAGDIDQMGEDFLGESGSAYADRAPCLCAEHVRQLEGESPFDNLMEVKS
jgi:hypothetical protein